MGWFGGIGLGPESVLYFLNAHFAIFFNTEVFLFLLSNMSVFVNR
jgi:hypothetical protein